ncbi:MAG: NAD kinase [Bacteroidales bacterium]|jgi:NAD+ kinase|nr:NAD kinase [Bacteroidales bacterium]
MIVAIFGITIEPVFFRNLNHFAGCLVSRGIKVFVYEPFFAQFIMAGIAEDVRAACSVFTGADELPAGCRCMFSIGGDGTLLQAARQLAGRDIPVLGINSGRLGFLSAISWDEAERAITLIPDGTFHTESRLLLQASASGLSEEFGCALNEITVTKKDNAAMLKINIALNGRFLATYWADGLIVATPTGSTAYSLSVGGPIMTPDTRNMLLSPVAPHNLSIRPIVVPDHYCITLNVEGRGRQFLISADSRSQPLDFPCEITIKKAPYCLRTAGLDDGTFFRALRDKLMWGADKRN